MVFITCNRNIFRLQFVVIWSLFNTLRLLLFQFLIFFVKNGGLCSQFRTFLQLCPKGGHTGHMISRSHMEVPLNQISASYIISVENYAPVKFWEKGDVPKCPKFLQSYHQDQLIWFQIIILQDPNTPNFDNVPPYISVGNLSYSRPSKVKSFLTVRGISIL